MEIKREEQTRFEYNLTVEKNKQMVDLMHQVRTPLMSIKLNASLVEAGQKEASIYLKSDPQCNAISQQLNASISELQTSISNLDKFVTSSLFLDDNNCPKNGDGNDHLDVKLERLPSDDIIMIVRPTQCNISSVLESVKNELLLSGICMQVEWLVEQDLSEMSLLSYPEALSFALRSVLTQASSSWGKASITVNFTLYEGRSLCQSQQPNITSSLLEPSSSFDSILGYLTIMMRISNPIQILPDSIFPTVSYKVDIKPIEKLLFDIGGDCRKITFDSESSSTSCFDNKTPLREKLIEVHIPCDMHTIITASENQDYVEEEDYGNSDIKHNNYAEEEIDMVNMSDIEKERDINRENDEPTISGGTLSTSNVQSPKHGMSVATVTSSGIEGRDQESNKSILNSDDSATPAAPAAAAPPSNHDQKKLRVLIVEDSAIIYKVLKRWLETEGCEVTVAENGSIGLTYLQTQQFDITLMDFIMVRYTLYKHYMVLLLFYVW